MTAEKTYKKEYRERPYRVSQVTRSRVLDLSEQIMTCCFREGIQRVRVGSVPWLLPENKNKIHIYVYMHFIFRLFFFRMLGIF